MIPSVKSKEKKKKKEKEKQYLQLRGTTPISDLKAGFSNHDCSQSLLLNIIHTQMHILIIGYKRNLWHVLSFFLSFSLFFLILHCIELSHTETKHFFNFFSLSLLFINGKKDIVHVIDSQYSLYTSKVAFRTINT